jgi:hypothetical protein
MGNARRNTTFSIYWFLLATIRCAPDTADSWKRIVLDELSPGIILTSPPLGFDNLATSEERA